MPQVLHARAVAKEIVRVIRVDHFNTQPLQLKTTQYGTLEYYPAPPPSWIKANTPLVMVYPERTRYDKVTLGTTGQWQESLAFRILHFYEHRQSEDVWEVKGIKSEALVETLFENYRLTALTLTNAQVLTTRVRDVDFRPPEEAQAQGGDTNLLAYSISYEAVLVGVRNA